MLVQNELHYTNNVLSTLAVLASTMHLIRGLDTDSWPHLCFLLRNWQLEMTVDGRGTNTEDFLTHLLDDKGDSHDGDRQVNLFLSRSYLFVLSFHILKSTSPHIFYSLIHLSSSFESPSGRECSIPCPIHPLTREKAITSPMVISRTISWRCVAE